MINYRFMFQTSKDSSAHLMEQFLVLQFMYIDKPEQASGLILSK